MDKIEALPPYALATHEEYLLSMLKQEDSAVRVTTLDLLCGLDTNAVTNYIPVLLKMLEDPDPDVRSHASYTLDGFSNHRMFEMLARQGALPGLGPMEASQKEPSGLDSAALAHSVPEMLALLGSFDAGVRSSVRELLNNVHPSEIGRHVPALEFKLQERDEEGVLIYQPVQTAGESEFLQQSLDELQTAALLGNLFMLDPAEYAEGGDLEAGMNELVVETVSSMASGDRMVFMAVVRTLAEAEHSFFMENAPELLSANDERAQAAMGLIASKKKPPREYGRGDALKVFELDEPEAHGLCVQMLIERLEPAKYAALGPTILAKLMPVPYELHAATLVRMLDTSVDDLEDEDLAAIAQYEPTILPVIYLGDDDDMHEASKKALGKLEPVTVDMPALMPLYSHTDADVRAIGRELLVMIAHSDPAVFLAVVRTLAELEKVFFAQQAPLVLAANDQRVREQAGGLALDETPPRTYTADDAPSLFELDDPEAHELVVHHLAEALEPDKFVTHREAVLAKLAPVPPEARAQALSRMLEDVPLGRMLQRGKDGLGDDELAGLAAYEPALLAAVYRGDFGGARAAAKAVLASFEPSPGDVPALLPLIDNDDDEVRHAVKDLILKKIEVAAFAPHLGLLFKALVDSDWLYEENGESLLFEVALKTLSQQEPAALAPHVPYLLAMVENKGDNAEASAMARGLLLKLEPAGITPHVAAMMPFLKHLDSDVRWAVVRMLAKLEPMVLAPHRAELAPLQDDPSSVVRLAMINSLRRVDRALQEEHAKEEVAFGFTVAEELVVRGVASYEADVVPQRASRSRVPPLGKKQVPPLGKKPSGLSLANIASVSMAANALKARAKPVPTPMRLPAPELRLPPPPPNSPTGMRLPPSPPMLSMVAAKLEKWARVVDDESASGVAAGGEMQVMDRNFTRHSSAVMSAVLATSAMSALKRRASTLHTPRRLPAPNSAPAMPALDEQLDA